MSVLAYVLAAWQVFLGAAVFLASRNETDRAAIAGLLIVGLLSLPTAAVLIVMGMKL